MGKHWKHVVQHYAATVAQRGRLIDAIEALRMRRSTAFIRAINYHWTPATSRHALEQQFEYFAHHYESVNEEQLRRFLAGKYEMNRPGILISFDDGFRNHFDVAAPLLEKYRLTGWFFVVVAACERETRIFNGTLNSDYCMDWPEVCDLRQRGHQIGCHTLSHTKLGPNCDRSLEEELVRSRDRLAERLQSDVRSFCFPYGTSDCYTPRSLACVAQNYEFAFHNFAESIRPGSSSLSIGRIPFEAFWSVAAARLRISGVFDLRYRRALREYERILQRTARAAGTVPDELTQHAPAHSAKV